MSATQAVLVVDDDAVFRERLGRALRDRQLEVVTAPDHEGALAAAATRPFDYAVIDLRMPSGSGLALIQPLHALIPNARILVLTGYGSIASAVEALRLGAHDYLSKPADADEIIGALRESGDAHRSRKNLSAAEAPLPAPPTLARAEWEHIQRVLADCGGNISGAARRLGITRRTLQLKLKKYPPKA